MLTSWWHSFKICVDLKIYWMPIVVACRLPEMYSFYTFTRCNQSSIWEEKIIIYLFSLKSLVQSSIRMLSIRLDIEILPSIQDDTFLWGSFINRCLYSTHDNNHKIEMIIESEVREVIWRTSSCSSKYIEMSFWIMSNRKS